MNSETSSLPAVEPSSEPSEPSSSATRPSLYGRVLGWLGLKNGDDHVREAIEELIEEREGDDTPLDPHERSLLENVLRLRNVTAADVMVPRADIDAIETGTSVAEATAMLVRGGHSRAPVYTGTLDEVAGMVHVKDLTGFLLEHGMASKAGEKSLTEADLLRETIVVSPTMRVADLLLEMRLKRTHMALVVDEYGGIDGLVTIEDLVEQIVGDIEDEHDEDTTATLVDRPDGTIMADARVYLEDFEDRFGPYFTDEERDEIDTLGGLVFSLSGRVPHRNELITHPSGLEFTILDADPRRIRRLRIVRGTPAEAEADTP